MIPVAVPADAERVIVDYLTATLPGYGITATVGVDLSDDWTTTDAPHVMVALDGTPDVQYPLLWRATVRLTVFAASTTAAKALAAKAQAITCAHPGSPSVGGVSALTGVLPAIDPDTRAPLASVTVEVRLTGTTLQPV